MTRQQTGAGIAAASTVCARFQHVGQPAGSDESGTSLFPPWLGMFQAREASNAFHLDGRDWHAEVVGSATFGSIRVLLAAHCSMTANELERPSKVDFFTSETSEWVTNFDFMTPPVFVAYPDHFVVYDAGSNHIGYETVSWLRDFLEVSQEKACIYAKVSSATFYMWRNRPRSMARPATVAAALRLRATLELVAQRVGATETVTMVKAGQPSLLDRLEDPATWDGAVQELIETATPAPRAGIKRMRTPQDYALAMRRLDEDDSGPDDMVMPDAEPMTPAQIAEAEAWGWDTHA